MRTEKKIELDEWWKRPFIVTQGYDEESYEEFCARMESNVDETEDEYNERVAKQKKSWHSHWPKGIRYDVYILDGGAWDRPTPKGKVGSLEEALEIVKDLLG